MSLPVLRKRSELITRFGRLALAHAALIAAAVTVAHATPEPLEILRKSILARTQVDFSGIRSVVVFRGGEKIHGVQQRVDCDAPNNLRIVVIAPESERGQLCLTVGREQWDYDPTTRRVVHSQLPSPRQLAQTRLEELQNLSGRMRMEYRGSETIAGRPTHVIEVSTTDGLPVKKSWVDTQYHLELKTQRFDPHGQVKSSAYFTQIDFSPTFAPGTFDFEPPAGATVVHAEKSGDRMPLEEAQRRAGFEAVLPTYLPPGYHFLRHRTALIEVSDRPTIWLSFSNGADTFSLFQRRASGEMEPIRRGQSITWQDGNLRFTLMGTLSTDELERVRASIRP